jgi:hypothetical protein
MSHARWMFAIVATLVSVACSDGPTNPDAVAGTLVLNLTTPHADDGALLFELNGPPIDDMTANDGSVQLFTQRVGGSTVGAVVGALANGTIVRLHVPDVSAGYRATVLEVANRDDALRASLAGYALTVIR